MDGSQIVTAYHDLWQIEESFRMTKSDLAARPVFQRKRDSIEAHATVVVASLVGPTTSRRAPGGPSNASYPSWLKWLSAGPALGPQPGWEARRAGADSVTQTATPES